MFYPEHQHKWFILTTQFYFYFLNVYNTATFLLTHSPSDKKKKKVYKQSYLKYKYVGQLLSFFSKMAIERVTLTTVLLQHILCYTLKNISKIFQKFFIGIDGSINGNFQFHIKGLWFENVLHSLFTMVHCNVHWKVRWGTKNASVPWHHKKEK